MAPKGKLALWVNDNLVAIVVLPLIVGIHYGWSKLQEVPDLVDQSKKKDIPIVAAFKSITNKLSEKLNIGRSGSSTEQEEKDS